MLLRRQKTTRAALVPERISQASSRISLLNLDGMINDLNFSLEQRLQMTVSMKAQQFANHAMKNFALR
jgi:hypothetical protein